AKTSWSLSSFTRKLPSGKTSVTTPSNSSNSSFAIGAPFAPYFSAGRHRRQPVLHGRGMGRAGSPQFRSGRDWTAGGVRIGRSRDPFHDPCHGPFLGSAGGRS